MAKPEELTAAEQAGQGIGIQIPSSVVKTTVRVCDEGDKYVSAIKKNYKTIHDSYNKIAKACKKGLKDFGGNSTIKSAKVDSEMSKVQKHATKRAQYANDRKNEISSDYAQTTQLFSLIN